ncbi:MAG: polysaccharide deacetylase family protein, partial [Burkholderiales bacterium]|nr:polysaccharide deacetylase family protein [Burkholderiales bacterium]
MQNPAHSAPLSVSHYPRDLIGYGAKPPHAQWPNQARIALQFVLNYEEGGENCVLHGDAASETFLSEIIGAQAFPMRHMSMESLYEYGSRAGLWRLLRLFEQHKMPLTIFGVAMALQRHPEAVAAFQELGHEIACHGLRWISYQNVDLATERAHLQEAMAIMRELTGSAPLGWYTGRDSPNTRRLLL